MKYNYKILEPVASRPYSTQVITIVVTEDCQLRCTYCYVCGKNKFHSMTPLTAHKVVDFLLTSEDFKKKDSVVFDMKGGEPFLEVDVIDDFCEYFYQQAAKLNHSWYNNSTISITTNGLLYDSEKVQAFIKKYYTHLDISISFDGIKEVQDSSRVFPNGSGSYERIMKQLPLWFSQFHNGSKSTVSKSSIKYIKDSVLFLWSIGFDSVTMNPVFEDVWEEGDDIIYEKQLVALADEMLENELYKTHKVSFFNRLIGFPIDPVRQITNSCGTGRMLTIDTEGNIYPCLRFLPCSLKRYEPIVIGNIFSGIDNNKRRPFLSLGRRVISSPECIHCNLASGCGWCTACNYENSETGTVFEKSNSICKMHHARIKANNYFWNKFDKLHPPASDDPRKVKIAMQKMQHLIMILDSAAPSFCYYTNDKTERQYMSDEIIKDSVYYALTHNLKLIVLAGTSDITANMQKQLYQCECEIIRPYSLSYSDALSHAFEYSKDVYNPAIKGNTLYLRISIKEIINLPLLIKQFANNYKRISLFIYDLSDAQNNDFDKYHSALNYLIELFRNSSSNVFPQLSFLTDRLLLDRPDNCEAGMRHITVAPDGLIYLCPGFYYMNSGNAAITDINTLMLTDDLQIKNKQLLDLDHSLICERCDSYQCKRCYYLNKLITGEINTPSKQQCMSSHIERNASEKLQYLPMFSGCVSIPSIDYLDPLEHYFK